MHGLTSHKDICIIFFWDRLMMFIYPGLSRAWKGVVWRECAVLWWQQEVEGQIYSNPCQLRPGMLWELQGMSHQPSSNKWAFAVWGVISYLISCRGFWKAHLHYTDWCLQEAPFWLQKKNTWKWLTSAALALTVSTIRVHAHILSELILHTCSAPEWIQLQLSVLACSVGLKIKIDHLFLIEFSISFTKSVSLFKVFFLIWWSQCNWINNITE